MLAIRNSFAGSVIVSERGVVLRRFGLDGHGLFDLDRRLGMAHRLTLTPGREPTPWRGLTRREQHAEPVARQP